MELHERFVSAFMGAIWGAVLGVFVGLFLHFVVGHDFDHGFLIINWKNIIVGNAALFAVMGLIFKASVATAIGTLISWAWNGIQLENSNNLWFNILIASVAVLIWYLYTKA